MLGHTLLTGLPLVLAIVCGLIISKWLAAEFAGRVWHLPADERGLMASLTLPQVAATLAAALVGYGTVNSAGVRLLDEHILNTVLVLVVVTSIVGPVLTERYVHRLAGTAPVPGDAEADPIITESA